MPLIIALALLLVTPIAYATGSPLVVYLMGGELFAFLVGIAWVVIAAKTWATRGKALAVVFLGLAGVALLHVVPDYLARQTLIEGSSIICLVLTFTIAAAVIRRG